MPTRDNGTSILLDPRCLPPAGAVLVFLTNHLLHRQCFDFEETCRLLTSLVDWELAHDSCCMDMTTKRIRAATVLEMDETIDCTQFVTDLRKERLSHDYVLVSDARRKVDRSLIQALFDEGRDDVYLVTETWNAMRSPRSLPLTTRSAWRKVNTVGGPCPKYGISSYFCMVHINEVKLDFGLVAYDETIEKQLDETWRGLTLDYKRAISFSALFGADQQLEMDHCHDILTAFADAHAKYAPALPERFVYTCH
jgi:hypothetical protein